MSDTLPEDGVARAEIDEMAATTVEAKTLRERLWKSLEISAEIDTEEKAARLRAEHETKKRIRLRGLSHHRSRLVEEKRARFRSDESVLLSRTHRTQSSPCRP